MPSRFSKVFRVKERDLIEFALVSIVCPLRLSIDGKPNQHHRIRGMAKTFAKPPQTIFGKIIFQIWELWGIPFIFPVENSFPKW